MHIPPKITQPLIETVGVEAFEATFSCFASGKPTPEYDWRKVGVCFMKIVSVYLYCYFRL